MVNNITPNFSSVPSSNLPLSKQSSQTLNAEENILQASLLTIENLEKVYKNDPKIMALLEQGEQKVETLLFNILIAKYPGEKLTSSSILNFINELQTIPGQISSIDKQITSLQSQLTSINQTVTNDQSAVNSDNQAISSDQTAVNTDTQAVSSDQTALAAANQTLASDQTSLNSTQQTVSNDQTVLNNLLQMIATDNASIQSLNGSISTDQSNSAAASAAIVALQTQIDNLGQTLSVDMNTVNNDSGILSSDQSAASSLAQTVATDDAALTQINQSVDNDNAQILSLSNLTIPADKQALVSATYQNVPQLIQQIQNDMMNVDNLNLTLASEQVQLEGLSQVLDPSDPQIAALTTQIAVDQNALVSANAQLAIDETNVPSSVIDAATILALNQKVINEQSQADSIRDILIHKKNKIPAELLIAEQIDLNNQITTDNASLVTFQQQMSSDLTTNSSVISDQVVVYNLNQKIANEQNQLITLLQDPDYNDPNLLATVAQIQSTLVTDKSALATAQQQVSNDLVNATPFIQDSVALYNLTQKIADERNQINVLENSFGFPGLSKFTIQSEVQALNAQITIDNGSLASLQTQLSNDQVPNQNITPQIEQLRNEMTNINQLNQKINNEEFQVSDLTEKLNAGQPVQPQIDALISQIEIDQGALSAAQTQLANDKIGVPISIVDTANLWSTYQKFLEENSQIDALNASLQNQTNTMDPALVQQEIQQLGQQSSTDNFALANLQVKLINTDLPSASQAINDQITVYNNNQKVINDQNQLITLLSNPNFNDPNFLAAVTQAQNTLDADQAALTASQQQETSNLAGSPVSVQDSVAFYNLSQKIANEKNQINILENSFGLPGTSKFTIKTEVDAINAQIVIDNASLVTIKQSVISDQVNMQLQAAQQLASDQSTLATLQAQLRTDLAAQTAAQVKLNNDQNALNDLNAKVQVDQANLIAAQNQFKADQNALTNAQSQLQTQQANYAAAQTQLSQDQIALSAAQAKLNADSVAATNAQNKLNSDTSLLASLQSKVQADQAAIHTIQMKQQTDQSALTAAKAKLQTDQTRLTTDQAKLQADKTKQTNLKTQISSLQTQETTLNNQLKPAITFIDSLSPLEKQMLQELFNVKVPA